MRIWGKCLRSLLCDLTSPTIALQACANAEAAYTRTLTAASKVKLVGDCDGASVRGALDGFSDLPFMIGQVIAIRA